MTSRSTVASRDRDATREVIGVVVYCRFSVITMLRAGSYMYPGVIIYDFDSIDLLATYKNMAAFAVTQLPAAISSTRVYPSITTSSLRE